MIFYATGFDTGNSLLLSFLMIIFSHLEIPCVNTWYHLVNKSLNGTEINLAWQIGFLFVVNLSVEGGKRSITSQITFLIFFFSCFFFIHTKRDVTKVSFLARTFLCTHSVHNKNKEEWVAKETWFMAKEEKKSFSFHFPRHAVELYEELS